MATLAVRIRVCVPFAPLASFAFNGSADFDALALFDARQNRHDRKIGFSNRGLSGRTDFLFHEACENENPKTDSTMTQKMLLSANQSVAWAAYLSGCRVAAAYPGTPSTEIMEHVADLKDAIDCEWSVNEKVAMEIGVGASLAGVRTLVAMKHVGLNVAMDPLMTFTHVGAIGGMVLVNADDPSMHSSQNEQDNRNLAKFARCLLFEPSDSQEAFDMVSAGFDLSEQYQVPVIVRLTTRTSHSSTVVDLGDAQRKQPPAIPYVKNAQRNVAVPAFARLMRSKVEHRTAALRDLSENAPWNRAEPGSGDLGIVASGVAYHYAKEVFADAPVFKVGLSFPPPIEKIRAFAATVKRIAVVEESDPVLADQIRAAGMEVVEPKTELRMMELNPTRLAALRAELLGTPAPVPAPPETDVPVRPPVLCSGCSHRGPFYILSKLKATVCGDIGCYTLGAAPPLAAMDTCICMGAAIGTAFGMRKAGLPNRRIAAVMGDSTFFHSGMTGLLDVAYNKGAITVMVFDNRITAMTGHQQNPGSGKTLQGEISEQVSIAAIARSFGIRRVHEVEPYDLARLEAVFAECLDCGETAVVVVKGPCVLHEKWAGKFVNRVDPDKCVACGACFKLGCPAIVRGEPKDAEGKRFKSKIEPMFCTGCNLCAQTCKFGAISPAT
jgi:indolepyruvate ferredoxin oxidoreductase, alpha subunit